MRSYAAFLAMVAAGSFLFFTACGGGGDGSQSGNGSTGGGGSTGQPPSGGQQPSDAPTQYVAIDLNPSGNGNLSLGLGIGDGEQVGDRGTEVPKHTDTIDTFRAVLWRGSASSVVDLHPNGFVNSFAAATSGGIQVGQGQVQLSANTLATHALKWSGSAASAVDLNPSGFDRSEARGVAGAQIAGVGFSTTLTQSRSHALLWTSGVVVDLNPSGFSQSEVRATDGRQQVGEGYSDHPRSPLDIGHALLWTGTADSVVDLHPANGFDSSAANSVSGGQQVGVGATGIGSGTLDHALLWTGSAGSVIDLHPSGFDNSVALGVAGGRQVGWGTTSAGLIHALVWNGTAKSVVDLHAFLPPGFVQSKANGIDASGNIIGTADGHAILWVPQQR